MNDLSKRHAAVWAVIDAIAARQNLSVSGLAGRCGLDPTTFNKSKRIAPDGHQRWPSMETVAEVLSVSNLSFTDFGRMVDQAMSGDSLAAYISGEDVVWRRF